MALEVDVEVIPLEMRIVDTVDGLLVEGGTGVDRYLVDMRLLRPQEGDAAQYCRRNQDGNPCPEPAEHRYLS